MDLEESKKIEFSVFNKEDLRAELRETILETIAEFRQEKIWITQAEVKDLMSIKSSTTIQGLRDKGLIEFTSPMKKLILYKKSSVLEYLEKHSHKTF